MRWPTTPEYQLLGSCDCNDDAVPMVLPMVMLMMALVLVLMNTMLVIFVLARNLIMLVLFAMLLVRKPYG